MDIKATDVKALRQKTGAGMMDCKKALLKTGGDAAKAEKLLKEMGLAAAAKRSDRATNEGRVFSSVSEAAAAVLELSSETDFVSRNKDFIAAGERMVSYVVEKNPAADDAYLKEEVDAMLSSIKENIALRRFAQLSADTGDCIVDYIHGEGNIGVLVKLNSSDESKSSDPIVKDLAFDIALHVAAYNPLFLSKDDVAAEYLKEQEEIFSKQAEALGKPENVTAGIVKGKMAKHLSEICLVDQGFVKEEKKKVSEILSEKGKELSTTLKIVEYRYFRVGEDIA